MTTINEAKVQISTYFLDKWEDITPVSWDNTDDNYAKGKKPWIRASIRMSTGGQHSLGSPGNRLFTRKGYLIFQVFTPTGEATEESDKLVQKILDIFDGAIVGDVNIINGSPTYVKQESKWFQQNVEFTIIFSEIK